MQQISESFKFYHLCVHHTMCIFQLVPKETNKYVKLQYLLNGLCYKDG